MTNKFFAGYCKNGVENSEKRVERMYQSRLETLYAFGLCYSERFLYFSVQKNN